MDSRIFEILVSIWPHLYCLSSYGFGFSNFSLGGEREQNERFMAKFRRAPPNDCINLIFTVYIFTHKMTLQFQWYKNFWNPPTQNFGSWFKSVEFVFLALIELDYITCWHKSCHMTHDWVKISYFFEKVIFGLNSCTKIISHYNIIYLLKSKISKFV